MIIVSSILTYGQSVNLVYNPSFEEGEEQCSFTVLPFTYERYAYGWWSPSNGTPDTFSTKVGEKACYAYMPYAGVDIDPENPHFGSILPRTGSRFAGMATYGPDEGFYAGVNYREYIATELREPMKVGEYYCVEMHVAMADRIPKYAANNLGFYFCTKKRAYTPTISVVKAHPQIVSKEVIESASWVKISGTFKADSAYKFMTIGNFFSDAETTAKWRLTPILPKFSLAFYYIDDVSVRQVPLNTIRIEGPAVACENEFISLTAKGDFEGLKWTLMEDTTKVIGTSSTLNVNPKATTSYQAVGIKCGLIRKDTITVRVNPIPKVNLGKDTTLCVGDSFRVDAGPEGITYRWSDSSTERLRTISQAGTYSVTAVNQFQCKNSDEIKVFGLDIPKVKLGKDSILCEEFYELKAGKGHDDYLWSTGVKDSVFTPTQTGTYWVKATNQCGVGKDTITLYSYQKVFIPNVVTVNGDNKNDRFEIKLNDTQIQSYSDRVAGGEIRIYDRWGVEVYFSKDYQNDWPRDLTLSSGTYYYTITYLNCRSYKGWVNLIY